eukprot:TRINITY_DN5603_c0_g1_i1.p1 TRINITY_DN5603_c0_g1~~TRINITY_DN5603_c0_g1_i1.p1  ORF type:complete len:221 (+),score=24.79 TRINITY_DN5603_c0_g1_i1:97-759(+)
MEYHRIEQDPSGPASYFYYIYSPWVVLCQLIFLYLYLAAIIYPVHASTSEYSPFELKVVSHICLWVIVAGLNRFIHYFMRQARQRGYLQLYRQTKLLVRLPVIIWAFGNAANALLLIFVSPSSQEFFLIGVVATEMLSITVCSIIYCVLVIKHNRNKPLPDPQTDFAGRLYRQSTSSPMMDLSDRLSYFGNPDQEIIESQAEMLRYREDQQESLSRLLTH